MPPPPKNYNSIAAFHKKLLSSRRILAVCGAAGALWRTHKAADLATPGAFCADPGLVWSFYAHRRRAALGAEPNRGHLTLAALARRVQAAGEGREFLCLSQNVDGPLPYDRSSV
ncbi:DHS-like NAD/FAD-binding domain-containing protein [Podospora appendiculata]|uniref:DHS-like NAD/FAD-binding domain-containing protein n=1 Tax=Podospora appendiculata TaxID=314037 RepID=A0AAE1CFK0_9PEZI|nr:DHS-like NAD/FAD-binding domain-containing protein [Podospora appendiculata]